nr:N-acetylmuramoyl-L-alanine amidase C-terminal domain-containing protein [Bacillus toyonensis]
MLDTGIDGQIIIQRDSIRYAVKNGYSSGNIDNFTAWLGEHKW